MLCSIWTWQGFERDAHAARRIRFLMKTGAASAIQDAELAYRPASQTQAQTWILWAWNDKGYMVSILWISTRFLFVSRVGVQLTVYTPSGKVIHKVKEYTLDKFKARRDRISLSVNNSHSWEGGARQGRVMVNYGDLQSDLQYVRVLDGFRAMNGPMRFHQKIFEGIPFGPRLDVKGTIRIKGEAIAFSGLGYADYSLQTIIPKRLARRWYAFRAMNAQYTIIGSELLAHSRWHPTSVPALSIAKGKQWLFHGLPRHIRYRTDQIRADQSAGYRVPMRVIFRCKDDNGTRYLVDIQHKTEVTRLDLMSHINPVLRFILQQLLSKPFVYRYLAQVKLTITPPPSKKQPTQHETMTGYGEWMFVQ